MIATSSLLLASLVLGPRQYEPAAQAAGDRPNLILILLDDLSYVDLFPKGGKEARTPHLDALAAEGKRFTQAYSNSSVCSPSRAALLTGRYPLRFGLQDALKSRSRRGLPTQAVTLAEVLRGAGYATGHFGKWHLGNYRDSYLPGSLGFDHSVVYLRGSPVVNPGFSIDGAERSQATGHLTELLTDHALEFIDQHRERPFFLNLWHRDTHQPLEPPPRWAVRFEDTEQGRFAAVLGHVDEQIGRILERIREHRLDSNTLVIFTSDNGNIDDQQRASELRGAKSSLYEGGIRVPLIARWVGKIPGGTTCDSIVAGFDILPTVAQLFAVDVGHLPLAGESFAKSLLGTTSQERSSALFWSRSAGVRDRLAMRKGKWKLVFHDRPQLFDLVEDPLEEHDLSQRDSALLQEMLESVEAWRLREARIAVVVAGESELDFETGDEPFAVSSELFNVDDGAFTMALTVTPEGFGHRQVIAIQPGVWRLSLHRDGRLVLGVHDDGFLNHARGPILTVGREHHVVFSFQYLGGKTVVRMAVDDYLEASIDVPRLGSGEPVVQLGGEGRRVFVGSITDPAFYCVALQRRELPRFAR